MRRAFGVTLYIFAGFFVYTVCLLTFINQPAIEKWGIVSVFMIPALIFLFAGLSVNRFRNWRRHVGIVLLSGAGITLFIAVTFIFLLMDDEFKKMMHPDTIHFYTAYTSGFIFIISVVALGIFLLTTEKRGAEQHFEEGMGK